MNYSYPINVTWTKEEIADVVNFFSLVEQGYEKNVDSSDLLLAYNRFRQIVPSKGEEKTMFAAFKDASGYSSYHIVKKAKESNKNKIVMKE